MTRSFHNAVVGFNHILAEPTHVFSEKGSEEMKRKILSLLLVFVLLCGMLPAALAVDHEDSHSADTAWQTNESKHWHSCSTTDCEYKYDESDHSWKYESVDDNQHKKYCETCKYEVQTRENHDFSNGVCKDCGKQQPIQNIPVTSLALSATTATVKVKGTTTLKATVSPDNATDKTVKWKSDKEDIATVDNNGTITGVSAGKATITATVGDKTATCEVTVEEDTTTPEDNTVTKVQITTGDITLAPDETKYLDYTAKNAAGKTVTPKDVSWKSSKESVATVNSSGRVTAKGYGKAEITITADGKTDYINVYVEDSYDADISVTIYDGDEEYVFGDSPSVKGKSVYDQLSSQLTSSKIGYREKDFDDLDFSLSTSSTSVGTVSPKKGSVDEFDEVSFSVKKTGTFTCDYTIKDGSKTVLSGIIEIIVKEGKGSSKGDISYTGTRGGTVYFDARDFEDYFEDEYPRGELEYVTFGRASNGTVYYDGKKISTSDEFYANPGKRDKDLDEVYYEPSSDTYTGTATVSFTAYGENSSGTSKSTSGVISIVYSSANAKDISYQATNGSVRLNADDFISTYKKATGVTSSNPTMYIRFTKLPSKGNLYVNYTSNGGGSRVSTSTYYSSKSSASNYIGDITYAADAAGGTETVEYTAYSTDSTSGLKYSGKIVFTANATNNTVPTTPVNISYTCTGGSVKFSNADFSGSSSSMMLIDYLVFGTPSTGALYTNYAGGTGNAVTSGQRFDYVGITSLGTTAVSSVSYVPPMGWSGTASVPFSAYLIGGGTITGTVTISVTAAATTVLRDVRTTDWYATYVTDLLAAGVLTGYEDNTFRAANNVTYGEILKLVMLATGYAEQSKSGAHWASGYVDRALTDGILTERVDPDAYASRAAVADIAARAMRLSPVTDGVNPFTDSVNGYARALYNAGIITGYEEGGRTYYRGGNPIERAHIAAIICRIMDYTGKAPSQPSTTPTPPRTDVEIPDWLRS